MISVRELPPQAKIGHPLLVRHTQTSFFWPTNQSLHQNIYMIQITAF